MYNTEESFVILYHNNNNNNNNNNCGGGISFVGRTSWTSTDSVYVNFVGHNLEVPQRDIFASVDL
jgi:hypothetical protein